MGKPSRKSKTEPKPEQQFLTCLRCNKGLIEAEAPKNDQFQVFQTHLLSHIADDIFVMRKGMELQVAQAFAAGLNTSTMVQS